MLSAKDVCSTGKSRSVSRISYASLIVDSLFHRRRHRRRRYTELPPSEHPPNARIGAQLASLLQREQQHQPPEHDVQPGRRRVRGLAHAHAAPRDQGERVAVPGLGRRVGRHGRYASHAYRQERC